MRTFCRNDDIIIRTAESFFVIKEPHKECNVINYYCRGADMREMEFKVERNGLLKEGDIVNVIETELESFSYYTIEHAYGMSGNIPLTEPLKNLTGKVIKMEEKPRGFYAVLEFDEQQ